MSVERKKHCNGRTGIKTGQGAIAVGVLLAAMPMAVYGADIPAGLTVDNESFAGRDAQEAILSLEQYIRDMEEKKIFLDIAGDVFDTSFRHLGYSWDNEEEVKETITKYTTGNVVERFVLKEELAQNPVSLSLDAGVDRQKVEDFVSEHGAGIDAEAVDATIRREGSSFVITESQRGVAHDLEKTLADLEEAISSSEAGEDITLAASVVVTEPAVSKEELEKIDSVLGTYTTNFSSSSAARATNIQVGTSKIDGFLLMPGETLSGYDCMNPFTVANGYKIAHAYENGQVVDSVGGGACQIATTLYNASLRAEIEITQRQNHSMTVGYVPASADAAIAGTYKDIKVTNNRDYPLYVEGIVSGRNLTFTIWGQEDRPENRTIEFVSEILSSTPAGVTYQDDPTLPMGREVKVSSGHNGRRSKLWKVVKVDGVEVERTLVSTDSYMVSNSIVRRGTMPVADPAAAAAAVNPGDASSGEAPSAPSAPTDGAILIPAGPGGSGGPGVSGPGGGPGV